MSMRTLHEWIAYSQLEPWDETRQDYRAASMEATFANCTELLLSQMTALVGQRRQKKTWTLRDFLLSFDDKPKKKQTWQQQKAMFHKLAKELAAAAEKKRQRQRRLNA